MLGIPASIAGVERIAVCTPPGRDGRVPRPILAACELLGIDEIYAVGGAQAVGALAYGTETVAKVVKIVGPGNAFVSAAKAEVSVDPEGAAIDMLAGPSELMIIADGAAVPSFVAADMLSQAEQRSAVASRAANHRCGAAGCRMAGTGRAACRPAATRNRRGVAGRQRRRIGRFAGRGRGTG